MANLIDSSKYLDLEGLSIYDGLIKGVITAGDQANAVALDALKGTLAEDISGKEDKTSIESVATGSVALSADVSKYYTFVDAIETFAITLPSPTDVTKVQTTVFFMTIGTTPAITFNSTLPIYYHDGFELEAGKTYEINCLYNGAAWVVSALTIIKPFFAKLTLTDGSIVELEDSGKLTQSMVSQYKNTLVSAEIGELCTSIGNNAFQFCNSLTSVDIPDSVTSIGTYAFAWCSSLTSITIPNSVTSIGNNAFNNCSGLISVTIGSGVTSIGSGAFQNCKSLTSVDIPDSVTSIVGGAFAWCSSLTSITIPNSVTTIGDNAFQDCNSLTSVTIPDSVTSIGYGAFKNCNSLTSITIPNSVTTIGDNAFNNCSGLISVTIGSGVTSIGESVLSDCSSLTSVTIEATTPPTLEYGAFDDTNNCPIYVPSESVETYKADWSDYASRIQAIQ